MGELIDLGKAIAHNWRRDGNIDPAERERIAWAICPYLRDLKPCNHCRHEGEDCGERGFATRGCRVIADEVVNICQTGNPWRRVQP